MINLLTRVDRYLQCLHSSPLTSLSNHSLTLRALWHNCTPCMYYAKNSIWNCWL